MGSDHQRLAAGRLARRVRVSEAERDVIAENAGRLVRRMLQSEELDSSYSAGLVADMLQEMARFLAREGIWAPDLIRYAERLRTGRYDWPEDP